MLALDSYAIFLLLQPETLSRIQYFRNTLDEPKRHKAVFDSKVTEFTQSLNETYTDMATRMYWNSIKIQSVRNFTKLQRLKKEDMLADAQAYADRSGVVLPEQFK